MTHENSIYIDQDAAAQLCNVSVQSFRQWAHKPNPPPVEIHNGRAWHKLHDLGEWIRREQIYKPGRGGGFPYKPDMSRYPGQVEPSAPLMMPGMSAPMEESERLTKLRADKIQLELDVAAGELIPAAQVEDAITTANMRIKTKLLGVPSILAPQIHGVKDVFEVQDVMEKAVRDVLTELATDAV
jgi:hypothetical protein